MALHPLKVAVVGCSHGELDAIYETIGHIEQSKNFKIDLLLICGDFQAVRNEDDLEVMACLPKYRLMRDFCRYYSGEKTAPVTTLFIGGNHESSQLHLELFRGGWVAKNIYFMGYANVLNFGGLRIAGLSGIYKKYDYRKGHFETPPLKEGEQWSVFHVRAFETQQLLQMDNNKKLDVLLTHDWPTDIGFHGNMAQLRTNKQKRDTFMQETKSHTLGSPPARQVMDHLKPKYHFAAHLHAKFPALVTHDATTPNSEQKVTRFLALSKVLPRQEHLQVIEFSELPCSTESNPLHLEYDAEWLAVVRKTNRYLDVSNKNGNNLTLQSRACVATESDIADVVRRFNGNLRVPDNFEVTVPPHNPMQPRGGRETDYMPNAQTAALLDKLGIEDKFLTKFAQIHEKRYGTPPPYAPARNSHELMSFSSTTTSRNRDEPENGQESSHAPKKRKTLSLPPPKLAVASLSSTNGQP